MKHLLALVSLFLLAGPLQLAGAQEAEEEDFEPTYALGDQILTINLGVFAPLFFASRDTGIQPTNLTAGGLGSIAWASYLNNEMTVGAEVGGSFAFTPNTRTLFLLNILGTYSYTFRSYPFEFPLHFGIGTSIARLADSTKLDLILKPGASFYWAYSAQWSFGLNLKYWWIPQIYLGRGDVPASDTRYGNFLEVSLSALYHF
jgi:hypothetical protein